MPSNKKKIVLAVSSDLATDQRVQKMADFLTSQHFEVVLLGRKLPTSPEVNFQHIHKRFTLWFKEGALFYANLNIKLFTYLLFYKTDVILSNDLDTLPACYALSKLRNKPLIFDSHEYFTQVPELIDRKRVQSFWKWIEKRIVPHLNHCITVSQSIADLFEKEYGVKFQVVRNVPYLGTSSPSKKDDSILKKYGLNSNTSYIIYQGALNLGRGIDLAIKSMNYVDDAILLLAGGGDVEKDLKELTLQKNLSDKVKFLGRIQPQELKKITAITRLGLSLEEDLGLNYRYGLPNKLFDYIHAEVPCLVADLEEMGNLVRKYHIGHVIKERNPEHVGSCINEAINNIDKRNQWIENTRKAKLTLNWEKETQVIQKEILPRL